MTKLHCVCCFSDSFGFIKQYIAFHLWQYAGGIVNDTFLTTHDTFAPSVQDNVFICHKCGPRTLECIMEHMTDMTLIFLIFNPFFK